MFQESSSAFNLEYLKKSAKRLLDACRAGNADAILRVQAALPGLSKIESDRVREVIRLADVHQALARESGFSSWAELGRFGDPLARLLAAVRGHHIRTVRQHLTEFAELAAVSVHAAAALGNVDALRRHLQNDPTLVSAIQDEWTPFMYVCGSPLPRISARHASSLATCATVLLDAGADLQSPMTETASDSTEAPMPAVFRALLNGNVSILSALQKRGAPPPADSAEYLQKRVTERRPNSAAMHKVFAEHFRRPEVREQFQSGQATLARTPGIGAMSFADPLDRPELRLPNKGLWIAMLDNGVNLADVNSTTGRSAIHGAAEYAAAEVVEAFLMRGGDPSTRDADGRTVLTAAIRGGNVKVVDLLKSRGVEDDSSPVDRLLGACLAVDRDAALTIVATNPVAPTSLSREDAEVAVRAAARGNVDQVRLMLDVGIDPNVEGEGGAAPLHQAAWRGQLEVVQLLLDRGADPEFTDRLYGQTAVEWALDGATHAEGSRDRCLAVVETLRRSAQLNGSAVNRGLAARAHDSSNQIPNTSDEMSNEALVAQLVKNRTLKTQRIIEAFLNVDRAEFVPADLRDMAYEDRPLPLVARATISQPTTVAFMLELLQPGENDRVLDVGSGSCWTTALLSACVGPNGSVIGTEIVPELVAIGQQNLAELEIANATIRLAGDQPGLPGQEFNKILVSAAAREMQNGLVAQLAVGGTMVIPVGTALCKVTRVSAENVETETYPGFIFVPLR